MNSEQPTNQEQTIGDKIVQFPGTESKTNIAESIDALNMVYAKVVETTKRQSIDNAKLGELSIKIRESRSQEEKIVLLQEVINISKNIHGYIDELLAEQNTVFIDAETAGLDSSLLLQVKEKADVAKQKNEITNENITRLREKLNVMKINSVKERLAISPEVNNEVFDQTKKSELASYILKQKEDANFEEASLLRKQRPDLHKMWMDGMMNKADQEVNSFVWEVINAYNQFEKEKVDEDVAKHSNEFLEAMEEAEELADEFEKMKKSKADAETLKIKEQSLLMATKKQQSLLYENPTDDDKKKALKERFYQQVTRRPYFPPFGFRFKKSHIK